jgi:bifunctional polynucleotide phosphatase/kinase
MEIVVLSGVPASGKSTLARTRFADYLRLNLDTLGSRSKEDRLIAEALEKRQSMVVDNTNTTARARSKYVVVAKRENIPIRAICIVCPLSLVLDRNSKRKGTKDFVAVGAIMRYHKFFEIPTTEEGFDSVEFVVQSPEDVKRVKEQAL